jgi:hypothetical protein
MSRKHRCVIAQASRQPFLDVARVLVAEGHSPYTILEARRPGASDEPIMQVAA